MAKVNHRNGSKPRPKTAARIDKALKAKAAIAEAPVPAPAPVEASAQTPIHEAVKSLFQNHADVRQAISTNLKDLTAKSQAIAERARTAFANFSPSKHSAADYDSRTYLAPDGDLSLTLRSVIEKGVEDIGTAGIPRWIRLEASDDLRALLTEKKGRNGSIGTMDLGDLLDYISRKASTSPSLAADPSYTSCAAELEAEKLIDEIVKAPTSKEDGRSRKEDAPAESGDVDELVQENVNLQMATATSPETQLLYAVLPNNADKDKVQSGIMQTFELRPGASDVTSYHDFNSLQIAFENVWSEIFDSQISNLGQQLYHEYIKLKDFAGSDAADPPIGSYSDLKALIAEIRQLSQFTEDDMPVSISAGSGGGATGSQMGTNQAIEVVKKVLDPASVITDAIGNKTVAAIVNPAGAVLDTLGKVFAGKQQLNWESFPGPLPVGNDIISTTFEEDAVPAGGVEIVIANSRDAWWWKGIEFWEFDATGKVVSNFKISNDPRDDDVWSKAQYNVLPLYTPQVQNAVIEFKKAAFAGVHTGYYTLSKLGDKLKDRTRVTFTWIKDS